MARQGRTGAAEEAARHPQRVLVIRLVPTSVLAPMLRRLRALWPAARLAAVIASSEGAEELASLVDEVVSTAGLGGLAAVRALRRFRPEVCILASGADYRRGATFLKGAALAALSGARRKWCWEPGDELPGYSIAQRLLGRTGIAPLREELPSGLVSGWLARRAEHRHYHGEPTRGPRFVQIGFSDACNYRCRMCPCHNPVVDARHQDADQPKLPFETFAELLRDLKSLGTRVLDIGGSGEPLTHPRAAEMITLAREMGFEVTLATNAGLLTEARARRMVDIGLKRMHVSVNAGSEESYAEIHPGTAPGTMGKIISRLRGMHEYARDAGLRPVDVEFSAVLNRLNMHELLAMVEAARAARAGWLMLIRMGPVEGGEELLPRPEDWERIRADVALAKELARGYGIVNNLAEYEVTATPAGTRCIYEEMPCYIGNEFSLIFASGMVNFCCHCYTHVGDITKARFAEVWRSGRYRQMRRQAMSLPMTKRSLENCGCFFSCSHVSHNLRVHERIHPPAAPRRNV